MGDSALDTKQMGLGQIPGADGGASFRAVTLPVGTVFHLQLRDALGSDINHPNDVITVDLMWPVIVNGKDVVPAGAIVSGAVIAAGVSAGDSGQPQLSISFTSLTIGRTKYDMQTAGFSRTAAAASVGSPGAVQSARGAELRFAARTDISTRLTAPLRVRVAS